MAITVQDNRIGQNEQFLNPKQEMFLKNYLDPQSDTFGNCTQSGIKAGFTPDYSAHLMTLMPSWLEETIGDARRLRLAEDNITSLLAQDEDLKVKADMTKFVSSTLGRKKYSTRTETDVTSKGESILGINYIVPADATVIPESNIRDAEFIEGKDSTGITEPEIEKTEIIPNEEKTSQ